MTTITVVTYVTSNDLLVPDSEPKLMERSVQVTVVQTSWIFDMWTGMSYGNDPSKKYLEEDLEMTNDCRNVDHSGYRLSTKELCSDREHP